jgi:hypothetical protein
MANSSLQTMKCSYDVSGDTKATADLGTAASHVPSDATVIPQNAIIIRCTTYVSRAMVAVGGTPTIKFDVGGIAMVSVQNCVGHASLADEKVTSTVVGLKTTAAGAPTVTIADQAINAGCVDIYVDYYLGSSGVA